VSTPSGPSPFEVSQDSVTARLSIEVPADTLENLHQVTQQVALLKTELEAAARAQSSYLEYLGRVPEIQERATQAQRSYITQLERSSAIEGEIKKSATGGTTGVTGHQDPFAGMTSGTGIRSQIEHLAETDPRQVLNMRAQRGDVPSPSEVQTVSRREDPDIRDEKREDKRKQDNAEQQSRTDPSSPDNPAPDPDPNRDPWRQLGTDVYSELRAGNASRALRMGASGAGQLAGGSRFASAAKGLGIAGGVVAAGMAINKGVQDIGETYQDYKNFGLMQGGGAAQGVGYEVQARMMAISPFITTEQSRKIIQAGLSQGYHGKEFETVTEMVAWNAKEMAKDIGTSFAEIRKSVVEGGQSKQGYQAEQTLLKGIAQNSTTMSLQQIQQVAGDVKSTLIDQGVPGGVAGQLGAETAAMFPDNMALSDIKGQIVQVLSTNESALYSIGQWAIRKGVKFPRNWYAADVPSILGENFDHYMWEWVENLAHVYSRDNPVMFQNIMGQYGVQLTRNQAAQLIQELGKPGNPADVGRSEAKKAAGKLDTRNLFQQDIGWNVSRAEASGELAMAPLDIGKQLITGHPDHAWDIIKHLPGMVERAFTGAPQDSSRYSNPVLQDLIKTFGGARNIEVLDEKNNPHPLNLNSTEQMEKLAKGEYKWRRKGSDDPGLTLEQSGQIKSQDDYRKTTEGGGQVSGQLQVTLAPDAKRYLQVPNTVQLTPNQQRSNSGWGDSTPNNPPPGDNLFPFLRPGG